MYDFDLKGMLYSFAFVGWLAGAVSGVIVWELGWWVADHLSIGWQ